MWKQLTQLFLNTDAYILHSERDRARIAYGSILIFGLVFTLYAFLVPFAAQAASGGERLTYIYRALRPNIYPLYTLSMVTFYVLGIYTWVRIRQGLLDRVTLAPAAMIYVGTIGIAAISNFAYAQNAFLLLPPILIAGLLDGDRGILIVTPIHFVVLVTGYAFFMGVDPANSIPGLILLVIVSAILLTMMYLYLRAARTASSETEEALNSQRLQVAQLTTRITRSMADADDLAVVLNELVHEIRDTFPAAYHVQIFLVDESGRNADLLASTGEVGRVMLSNKHSLPVGSSSVIGYVTQQQNAYRAVVGTESRVHRPNPYLPDTRLEVALPMGVGNRTIGALDLQSTDPDAFPSNDLTTLQAIADSIAVTVNNYRLLQQATERLRENQLLVERMTGTQREVERLNRELTGAIWSDYLRGQEESYNVDLDFESDKIMSSDDLSDAILNAINNDDVVRRVENGQQIVAIPLRVRGEVIGAMEFEVGDEISGADMDMLREVGERFGLAAENNRLYQNSQRVAQREALVNEINTRIQSANSVDATLSEAARSLRDALKAKRVAIRLGAIAPSQAE
jgi:GAF domain-containing protein